MSEASKDYWIECISSSLEEHGVRASSEQIKLIADDIEGAHECYGMAFYSPPPSDRIAVIESEHEARYRKLEQEFADYQNNAETAVKKALNQYPDERVTIGEYGEVLRHGGRTERVQ